MKGGASRKGRSPVRGWVREGEHGEAKFFSFLQFAHNLTFEFHINE